MFATRMTGTSSEALTLAIRFLYSTASLKLCLQIKPMFTLKKKMMVVMIQTMAVMIMMMILRMVVMSLIMTVECVDGGV